MRNILAFPFVVVAMVILAAGTLLMFLAAIVGGIAAVIARD